MSQEITRFLLTQEYTGEFKAVSVPWQGWGGGGRDFKKMRETVAPEKVFNEMATPPEGSYL